MSNIMLERSSNVKNLLHPLDDFVYPVSVENGPKERFDIQKLKSYSQKHLGNPFMARDGIVTTVIGFKCDDGIVLGADTQYTSTIKVPGEKLFPIDGPCGLKICVAGAGQVSLIHKYVQCLKSKLITPIAENKVLDNVAVEAVVEQVLEDVHNKYIDPVPAYNRPQLQLIIGTANPQGEPDSSLQMFKTELRVANPISDYDAIGAGEPLAKFIIETFKVGGSSTRSEAVLLAAYALQAAKDYDPLTGKETRIKALLPSGALEKIDRKELASAETYFAEIFESFKSVLAMVDRDDIEDEIVEEFANFRSAINEFRKRKRERRSQSTNKRETA